MYPQLGVRFPAHASLSQDGHGDTSHITTPRETDKHNYWQALPKKKAAAQPPPGSSADGGSVRADAVKYSFHTLLISL